MLLFLLCSMLATTEAEYDGCIVSLAVVGSGKFAWTVIGMISGVLKPWEGCSLVLSGG